MVHQVLAPRAGISRRPEDQKNQALEICSTKRSKGGGELLFVFVNDGNRFSLGDIEYDALLCKPDHRSKWFFAEFDDYLRKIGGFIGDSEFKKVLFVGNSKSGTASVALCNALSKVHTDIKFYCWALSPVVSIEWGKSIIDPDTKINLSPAWDIVKDDESIRAVVEKWGKVRRLLDGTFETMFSYTFDQEWTWDRKEFEKVRDRPRLTEDFVPFSEEIKDHNRSKSKYDNMHNLLSWHWRRNRDLMYEKIPRLTGCPPMRP